jgi:hypothetical protein
MSLQGSVLMWCIHHYGEHATALAEAGAVIVSDGR